MPTAAPIDMADMPVQLPAAPASAAARRARFFNSGNAFNVKLAPVPARIFTDEAAAVQAEGAATGYHLCDQSAQLGCAFAATTPLMLARYARIAPGDTLAADFAASGSIWYVIQGQGGSVCGAETIAWAAGDIFLLPGAPGIHHAGPQGAVLWMVSNEPQLAFDHLQPRSTDAPAVPAAMAKTTANGAANIPTSPDAKTPGGASADATAPGTRNVAGIATPKSTAGTVAAKIQNEEGEAARLVHYPADEIERQFDQLFETATNDTTSGAALIFSSVAQQASRNILPTLTLSFNTLPGGEHQRAHRHNSAAITLIVRGADCHSMVGGIACPWSPWATMVTPPGAPHSHHNGGTGRAYFLIVQDGGLHYHARTMGFEFME